MLLLLPFQYCRTLSYVKPIEMGPPTRYQEDLFIEKYAKTLRHSRTALLPRLHSENNVAVGSTDNENFN